MNEEKKEDRIGNILVGQRWISLKGEFTYDELKAIANRVEIAFNKAFNNGVKK